MARRWLARVRVARRVASVCALGVVLLSVGTSSAAAHVQRRQGLYLDGYSETIPPDGVIVLRAPCHRCDEAPKPLLKDGTGRSIRLTLVAHSDRLRWYAFKPKGSLEVGAVHTLFLPQIGPGEWWPLRVRDFDPAPVSFPSTITGGHSFRELSRTCCGAAASPAPPPADPSDFVEDLAPEPFCFSLAQEATRTRHIAFERDDVRQDIGQFAYRVRFFSDKQDHTTEWDIERVPPFGFEHAPSYCATLETLELRSNESAVVATQCYREEDVKYPSSASAELERLARELTHCEEPSAAGTAHFCRLVAESRPSSCASTNEGEVCRAVEAFCSPPIVTPSAPRESPGRFGCAIGVAPTHSSGRALGLALILRIVGVYRRRRRVRATPSEVPT